MTIGTNKSYLSEFLNSQGKSFYDYINEHRIDEACRILDAAKVGDRINMSHVATQSGFKNLCKASHKFFYDKYIIMQSRYSRSDVKMLIACYFYANLA